MDSDTFLSPVVIDVISFCFAVLYLMEEYNGTVYI